MLNVSSLFKVCRCAVAVALLSITAAVAAEPDQRIAIVNVSLIFENYKKTAEIQRKIDEIFKPQQNELSQRSEALHKKMRELGQYMNNPEQQAPAVFDAVQKVRREQFYFKLDLEKLNVEMQKMYTKEMREVLTDIRSMIRNVAERSGFQLVLRSPDTDDPPTVKKDPNDPAAGDNATQLQMREPRNVGEMVERFNRNPVLFGAQPTDITQEVLKRLNEDYGKRFNAK